jgi:hypothetical protein
MSENISLENAQAILNALVQAQMSDPIGALGAVTIGSRTVQYKSGDELIKMINYWSNLVTQLTMKRAGAPSFGRSVGVFTRR